MIISSTEHKADDPTHGMKSLAVSGATFDSEPPMRAPPECESPAPLANGCRAHETDQAVHRIDFQHNHIVWQRQGELESLASVHRSLGHPEDELIRWLLDQRVSEQAMMRPYCIGGGRVRFQEQQFEIDTDGEAVITFRAEDCGEVIDLIAYQPSSGKVGTLRGYGFCLGDADDVLNTATYFDGGMLWVHETPLQWLLAGRRGIVIVRRDFCNAYLAHSQRLAFPTVEFASKVERWMQPPKPTVRLYVRASA